MALGITIGEIGSKLGMNSTNNGFLAFDKVRIPRLHMLMKNAQVLKVNNYIFVFVNSLYARQPAIIFPGGGANIT